MRQGEVMERRMRQALVALRHAIDVVVGRWLQAGTASNNIFPRSTEDGRLPCTKAVFFRICGGPIASVDLR